MYNGGSFRWYTDEMVRSVTAECECGGTVVTRPDEAGEPIAPPTPRGQLTARKEAYTPTRFNACPVHVRVSARVRPHQFSSGE
jgi:hypothetical protein